MQVGQGRLVGHRRRRCSAGRKQPMVEIGVAAADRGAQRPRLSAQAYRMVTLNWPSAPP